MKEQILAELGNYVGSNLFALLLVLTAARWPRVARLLFSVLFVGGGVWNLFASLTMPAFYVTTYGHLATPPYAAFIFGPFAANPALFVVPIAFGELAIGLLATGTRTWRRLSMLGVVGAFPFSILAIVAAYLLFRAPLETSEFDDIGAVLGALRHGLPPTPHAGAQR